MGWEFVKFSSYNVYELLWILCEHNVFFELAKLTSQSTAIIGETVLVIGAGPSGMDLAYEISRHAKRVTLSHHQKPDPLTVFPTNVNMRPDVVRLTETGAEFADGAHQEYTVIFYCTGNPLIVMF